MLNERDSDIMLDAPVACTHTQTHTHTDLHPPRPTHTQTHTHAEPHTDRHTDRESERARDTEVEKGLRERENSESKAQKGKERGSRIAIWF